MKNLHIDGLSIHFHVFTDMNTYKSISSYYCDPNTIVSWSLHVIIAMKRRTIGFHAILNSKSHDRSNGKCIVRLQIVPKEF